MELAESPPVSAVSLRWKNTLASAALVVLAVGIHLAAPYNRELLATLYGTPEFGFTGNQFMVVVSAAYVLSLAAYFFREARPGTSKSVRFMQVVLRFATSPRACYRKGLDRTERVAVLSTLL